MTNPRLLLPLVVAFALCFSGCGENIPVTWASPSLSHLQVGQKYRYGPIIRKGNQKYYQIDEIKSVTDTEVKWTSYFETDGMAFDHKEKSRRLDRSGIQKAAADHPTRETITVDGHAFECIVMERAGQKIWTTPIFPPFVKMERNGSLYMELTDIE